MCAEFKSKTMAFVQVSENDQSFVSAGYPVVEDRPTKSCDPATMGYFAPPEGLGSTFALRTECELSRGVPFTKTVKNTCEYRENQLTSRCKGLAFNP